MTEKHEDEIIEEIRRLRETHAASFDFDLKRIVEELGQEESASGAPVVTRPPRAPNPRRSA